MQGNSRGATTWAWLVAALCLVVPSSGLVVKYGRLPGLVVYAAVVVLFLFVLGRWGRARLFAMLTERQALWLAVILLAAVAVVVAVVYPIANSGALGGGSDRDDAINLGVSALLRGAYPYRFTTYLDNPISPLPGAFLLGAPFVVLFGSSAYQNLFWLAICYLVVRRYYVPDRRELLLLSVAVLALSPAVWQELATGGDLLANSLYVFSFATLMIGTNGDAGTPRWQRIASAVLLGIGLASRANYVLVLLPVAVYISQRAGWRHAARSVGLSALVLALLVLPFYLSDPAGFSPLHAIDEVDWLGAILPHAGMLLIGLMVLTAALLALSRKRMDAVRFLFHCALPQSVPVVLGLAAIAYYRAPAYGYASFGLSFMFFGLVGSWALLARRQTLCYFGGRYRIEG